ncbi:MAG TPA: glycosyltransferase family 39 protein [Polyangiales bacterium]|nr:glycosyltransferase family 39 protein [Polyangiales bacterium]
MWRPDKNRVAPESSPEPAGSRFGGALRRAPANDSAAASGGKASQQPLGSSIPLWLWLPLGALLLQRAVYHAAYLKLDPFALVTISDGQLYERAARDLLAHPFWGSEPFYLQGMYAYLLSAGIGLTDSVVGGLALQLLAAAGGLLAFGLAARACFGPRVGLISLLVLLATPVVAFYENKYLSVSLGNATCMLALWAFTRVANRPNALNALLLGLCAGLCVLGRGNLLIALPFCALAAAFAASRRSLWMRLWLFLVVLAGAGAALLPMATRNLVVTGAPTVLPSHGGGIPFYIGNNPYANGRWNDAGGLITGAVWVERSELARRLQLQVSDARQLDAAIGEELYRRAFAFIREKPLAWSWIELEKIWCTFGNHAFVRDYDLFGERELLGLAHPIGLPFGIVLGLGVLGLTLITRRALATRHELAHAALCCMLLGLLLAVLIANLLWFTSAQNRAPLLIPLAFVAGPALDALLRRARGEFPAAAVPNVLIGLAVLLSAQAFVPRLPTERPSSTHYYNLANVEEELGRNADALRHYALATERNPKQPMFWWRRAYLARRMHRLDEAKLSLDKLAALPDLSPELRNATRDARRALK